MLLGARLATAGGGRKLPYDYRVEWIGSDGSSCIDIPLNVTVNAPLINVEEVELGCDVLRPTGSSLQYFFAVHPLTLLRAAVSANTSGSSTTMSMASVASKTATMTGTGSTERIDNVVFKSYTDSSNVYFQFYQDGSLVKDTTSMRSTPAANNSTIDRLTIFGYYNMTNTPPKHVQFLQYGHLKYLKIRSSSLGLDLDLVPVVKDGVGYLYNRTDGSLLGNTAETGDLVVGDRM